MIKGANHTGFTVADIHRSVDFWTGALGYELADLSPRTGDWQAAVTGVEGASLLVAHLYGPGRHHMEFIQYLAGGEDAVPPSPSRACAGHVCLEVSDIEAVWDRLIAAGATPQGRIASVDTGPVKGLRAAYIRDPGGVVIELLELPG